MSQATTTGRWPGWTSLAVASAAVMAGVFCSSPQLQSQLQLGQLLFRGSTTSILTIFAKEAFDWSSSTTPAPLSVTAVLVKAILSGKSNAMELGLERAVLSTSESSSHTKSVVDVQIAPVRDFVSARVLREVKQLCSSSSSSCDPNEVDPEFGTTPLHLAELWGSSELVEYLLSIGANPDKFDTVGRQPRNMTFKAFSANSKKAADGRLPAQGSPAASSVGDLEDMRCEIPEVIIPLFPVIDSSSSWAEEAEELHELWQQSSLSALAEVRRLVSEGEPVMVRNVVPWLKQQYEKQLQFPDAATFAEAWGHRPVDVGGVPYAKNFDLYNERKTLAEYLEATTGDIVGHPETRLPNYVFQVDTEACVEGYELLARMVEAALPSSGDKPIVCPPPSGLRGLESVHYYLGGRSTGAPFHVHSDALNLAMSGKKKWWVVTPRSAVWSRRHIREYSQEGKGGPADGEERPMEFVQRSGDMVYVPGDWGHAAMNLEDGTFG